MSLGLRNIIWTSRRKVLRSVESKGFVNDKEFVKCSKYFFADSNFVINAV